MPKHEAPQSPTLAELAERNIDLVKYAALLEGIGRAALESGHRHVAQLDRISAMARALAGHDGPDSDRASLASALQEACKRVETEARAHLEALQFAKRSWCFPSETSSAESIWHYVAMTPITQH